MVKISYVGDVMCDAGMSETLPIYKTEGKYNFTSVFSHISSLLKKSDYVLANLETPISFRGEKLTNHPWQFCSAYEFAEAVRNAGIDYVSTANNHCLDRGIAGLDSTIMALDHIGLEHSGTYISSSDRKQVIKDIKGIKVGILTCTYGTNAYTNRQYLRLKDLKKVDLLQEQEHWIDRYSILKALARRNCRFAKRLDGWIERKLYPENTGKQWYELITVGAYRRYLLKRNIRKMRKKADIVVMYVHVGGQYNAKPNSLTKRTIDWMLKCGCNIVIGNHEHVVHGNICDLRQNKIATYAIGNFLGTTGVLCEPYDKYSEFSIILHTYINARGKVEKVTFSVTKTIVSEDGKLEVWPVNDLLAREKNAALRDACLVVARRFSGRDYHDVEEEFLLQKSAE